MTILISLAHHEFVFLAADTQRVDLIIPNFIQTVNKTRHLDFSALAMAGKNVDRTAFADRLIERRATGEPFGIAATSVAHDLFAEKANLLQQLPPGNRRQVVFTIYGEASANGCTAQAHQIGYPESFSFPYTGILISGGDTFSKLGKLIADQLLHKETGLALDVWAVRTLAAAVHGNAPHIGFPCDLILLRKGKKAQVKHCLNAEDLRPDPDWSMPLSPTDLEFSLGQMIRYPAFRL